MISLNEFLVKKHVEKIQYEPIDLGLPSGLKWANCNVGANAPEDPGLLFQWGRVDGHEYNSDLVSIPHSDKGFYETSNRNYVPKSSSGKKYDKNSTLDLEDDAAHVNMKGDWRMPTPKEVKELIDNCDADFEEIKNAVLCLKLTSKINGNYILFPASGYFASADEPSLRFKQFGKSSCLWTSYGNATGATCYVWNSMFKTAKLHYPQDSVRRNAYAVRGVCK